MFDNFLNIFKDRVKTDFDLLPYSTLKIKSVAKYYFEAQSGKDFHDFFKLQAVDKFPYFVLGGGSNIAFSKDYYDLVVVRNRYLQKEILEENDEYLLVKISSGYPISLLVKETIELGLSGFEYHMGLPGTLGGAIYMNSKWTNPVSYIGDNLVEAEIITKDGELKTVPASYFNFSYGYSAIQDTHDFFLNGTFKLMRENKELLKKRASESLAYRKETQPYGVATGGCFFKNISEKEKIEKNLPTTSAGYLIDKCGLKDFKVGKFVVSSKHANFILNEGEGKPEDLVALISHIKNEVKMRFGVDLKEEVLRV